MPTFHANSTTVQLSVADLKPTITSDIQTGQSKQTTEQVREIAAEFAKWSVNGTLRETPINGSDGHRMRFLGKLEDMPFFMVWAGKQFFSPDSVGLMQRRPPRVPLYKNTDGFVLIDNSNKGSLPFTPSFYLS